MGAQRKEAESEQAASSALQSARLQAMVERRKKRTELANQEAGADLHTRLRAVIQELAEQKA